MNTVGWVILIIAIAAIIIAGVWVRRSQHTQDLRQRFGPEYDRVVSEQGSATRAEKELDHRTHRAEHFRIRRLTLEESNQFAAEWRSTQERFVDDPRAAIAEADRLVHRLMQARGYPIAHDFEERAADISVDHARVVDNYRAAHDIAARDSRGSAGTEDLRMAMKHYRALFEDLLDQRVAESREVHR